PPPTTQTNPTPHTPKPPENQPNTGVSKKQPTTNTTTPQPTNPTTPTPRQHHNMPPHQLTQQHHITRHIEYTPHAQQSNDTHQPPIDPTQTRASIRHHSPQRGIPEV
ncbi:hypothetical protein ACFFIW_00860, partial [Bifidobacterium apri]